MALLEEQIKKLPEAPGVYFFKAGKEILYVGKAASLRDRVKSYFSCGVGLVRGPLIEKMLEAADRIDFVVTDSVLEALLLEAEEIKKRQPRYNVREKDDKSFWYVGFTEEEFPRVLLVRGKDLKPEAISYKLKAVYGSFPVAGEIKAGLKILRKIFPFRDTCRPASRPCFNAQLGLCPGVCVGRISAREYRKNLSYLALFFAGRKRELVRRLEKKMKLEAKRLNFETAAALRKQLFALTHIQDIALLKEKKLSEGARPAARIEAYDVAHTSGRDTVGAMAVWEDGELKKDAYRRFRLAGPVFGGAGSNDSANLAEMLRRRLNHKEWPRPSLIVVDGSAAQMNAARRVLEERLFAIPVIGVVKDEYHRPKELRGPSRLIAAYVRPILLLNREAHRFAVGYHRKLRNRMV